jgi:DNA-directed RNA polymerase subunit RPC12/RpoP
MTEPNVTTLSVSCNHCGAPLQIPTGTRFLTCTYCGSRLEVHQSQGAVYTKVLQSIDKIAEDVSAIRRQNELEQLDREWMLRRDSLLVRGKDGRTAIPSTAASVVVCIITVVVGIGWTIGTASAGAPGLFTLFGLAFIAIGILTGISGATKASQYADAERDYQQRRQSLLRQTGDPR